ncbi:glycoside hydrolase family 16 protein [Bacillus tamaricis]|uniref:Glycoside hydrolase family 16 protein n=2 Tax=Evansella tamaricis TaxID=2069301 RepID=A0ABS6JED5_9BACI|nr:glycoside hydrolase family 16 protein [Evansella tamaricis]
MNIFPGTSTSFSKKNTTDYLVLRPAQPIISERLLNHSLIDSSNEPYYHSFKKDGWELIWQDEFEKEFLDEKKWNTEDWAAEKNKELQFYTSDNVLVDDGHLKLVSKNEDFNGRDYTSGAVHSKDKFYFKYGKVEMRAKLPIGQGIYPAFWMMPNVESTWLPQISIMEFLGHQTEEVWSVLHWLNEHSELKTVESKYSNTDFSQGFHIFGMEWDPNTIIWYIDGEEVFRTEAYIPDTEMYLYINTAIGGDWPGSPDKTTVFPQSFEVDYVRVYQKSGGDQ